jgi:hypothetical protein
MIYYLLLLYKQTLKKMRLELNNLKNEIGSDEIDKISVWISKEYNENGRLLNDYKDRMCKGNKYFFR